MLSMLKTFGRSLLNILLPRSCHVCSALLRDGINAFDENICSDCRRRIEETPLSACRSCAATLDETQTTPERRCRSCRSLAAPAFEEARACFLYDGPMRTLIRQLKYGERPYLARTAGRLMQNGLPSRFLEEADMIVPVPLSPARRRERTFNQAQEIARELGAASAKPVVLALKRVKETRPQAELKEKDRFPNVEGAFGLVPGETVRDKDIVLVDDVITTTATVRAAARTLAHAGARRIRVLALAKG
jgi:ComF family protein